MTPHLMLAFTEIQGLCAVGLSSGVTRTALVRNCVEHKLTMLHERGWMAYVSQYCGWKADRGRFFDWGVIAYGSREGCRRMVVGT